MHWVRVGCQVVTICACLISGAHNSYHAFKAGWPASASMLSACRWLYRLTSRCIRVCVWTLIQTRVYQAISTGNKKACYFWHIAVYYLMALGFAKFTNHQQPSPVLWVATLPASRHVTMKITRASRYDRAKKYLNKSTEQEYLQTRCIPTVFHRNSEKLCSMHLVCKHSCSVLFFDTFWHCHPYLLL